MILHFYFQQVFRVRVNLVQIYYILCFKGVKRVKTVEKWIFDTNFEFGKINPCL